MENNTMQKEAWKTEKICDLILNREFPHIIYSDHFESLTQCLQKIKDIKNIIDVGCGNAEFGDVCQNVDYTGADLPHIINKVASIKRPNFNYITLDVEQDDLSFLNNYDLVFMNAFISEMKNPIETLGKILDVSKKYVLVHRQDVGETTYLEEYTPYDQNLIATNSTVSRNELQKTITDCGFTLYHMCNSFSGLDSKKTFLLKKDD